MIAEQGVEMQPLKSASEGVGTAAGVAWPSFAIVFGSLGLMGASTVGITLGSIFGGIFFLVGLPVAYWSYVDAYRHYQKINQTIEEQEDQFNEQVYQYLLTIIKELFLKKKYANTVAGKKELYSDFRRKIQIDLSKPYPDEFIIVLRNLYNNVKKNNVLKKYFLSLNISERGLVNIDDTNKVFIKDGIKSVRDQSIHFVYDSPPIRQQIKSAVTGFAGSFGSVAGCSAGSLGLLTALGVFPGFAAVPVVGWAVLAVAFVFGVMVAGYCLYSFYKMNKKQQKINQYEAINRPLEKIILLRNKEIILERNRRLDVGLSEENKDQLRVPVFQESEFENGKEEIDESRDKEVERVKLEGEEEKLEREKIDAALVALEQELNVDSNEVPEEKEKNMSEARNRFSLWVNPDLRRNSFSEESETPSVALLRRKIAGKSKYD